MGSFVKPLTWILGIVLVIVGILGFFASNGMVLGMFQVDMMHNIIHLLSGVIALGAASTSVQYSRLYLIVFGLVYGLVTVLGFMSSNGSVLGLITVNSADNYLHLVIAAVCLVVGFGSKKA